MESAAIHYEGAIRTPLTRTQLAALVAQCQKKAPALRKPFDLYVVSKAKIKKLNNEHRGRNAPTDVLSFVWSDVKKSAPGEPIGELYIAPEHITQQAKIWGVSVREEFTRSCVHGLLHLAGFDHVTKHQAKKMFSLQERLVAQSLALHERS